ncbi:hypothetical protein SAMN05216275_1503 [Streptosporangium canum]|uniref:Uncharacterized protein n=1 Tax=Streptosporangium canum TaxID=324952 RepID=A0A1I4EKU4_9ACTN|nr:hypothetical protein SAMN05216275_1503 [Streptosporangium canum]
MQGVSLSPDYTISPGYTIQSLDYTIKADLKRVGCRGGGHALESLVTFSPPSRSPGTSFGDFFGNRV